MNETRPEQTLVCEEKKQKKKHMFWHIFHLGKDSTPTLQLLT